MADTLSRLTAFRSRGRAGADFGTRARGYWRDVADAKVYLLEAGHYALETITEKSQR